MKPELVLFDDDDFYQGLPALKAKDIRKFNQLRVNKKEKLAQTKQYLLQKQQLLQKQLKEVNEIISSSPETVIEKKLRER